LIWAGAISIRSRRPPQRQSRIQNLLSLPKVLVISLLKCPGRETNLRFRLPISAPIPATPITRQHFSQPSRPARNERPQNWWCPRGNITLPKPIPFVSRGSRISHLTARIQFLLRISPGRFKTIEQSWRLSTASVFWSVIFPSTGTGSGTPSRHW